MEQQSKPSLDETSMEQQSQHLKVTTSRRSFLSKGLAVGGAGVIGAGLLANGLPVFAEEKNGSLTKGDIAILNEYVRANVPFGTFATYATVVELRSKNVNIQ